MKIAICDDDKKLSKELRHLIEVQLDLMAITYEIEEYESGTVSYTHLDVYKRQVDVFCIMSANTDWMVSRRIFCRKCLPLPMEQRLLSQQKKVH